MANWSVIEWVLGYVGVAGLALFMLDRSHRNAMAKLTAIYDKELEHQKVLIEVLQVALDTERMRDSRRARVRHPDLETSE